MNLTYTVRFHGVPPKLKASLDRMFRDEVAGFKKRVRMDSATVEEAKKRKGDVPLAVIKAAVKKVRANAKS